METPHMSHIVSKDYDEVYEPAEDSFLLIDALEADIDCIRNVDPLICVEIGTGSGIIVTALGMILGSKAAYIATDINPKACEVAQKTGYFNNVQVNVVNTNLANSLRLCNNVDILLFNPPYVVTVPEEMESCEDQLKLAWAGGNKGREVMDRLFPEIPQILSSKGLFYLLVTSDNCPSEIEKIMLKKGYVMKYIIERKIRGEHLYVLRFKKDTEQFV